MGQIWVNHWAYKRDDIMTGLNLHFIHKIGVYKICCGQLSRTRSQLNGRKGQGAKSMEENCVGGFLIKWMVGVVECMKENLTWGSRGEENIVLPFLEKVATFELGFLYWLVLFLYLFKRHHQ